MTKLPDLSDLSHSKKDALIRALWAQIQALTMRVAELEAKLGVQAKNSDNSSQPPSHDKKADRDDKANRQGPRQGSATPAMPDDAIERFAFRARPRRIVAGTRPARRVLLPMPNLKQLLRRDLAGYLWISSIL